MTKTKINIDVYSTTVNFIVCEDVDATYKEIRRKHNEPVSDEESEFYGLHFRSKYEQYILIEKQSIRYNTICHEIFHCAFGILNNININAEEAIAWLIGFISQEIFKFLHKNNITIKHGTKS